MNTVKKAIIPVAGWGTRMLPITKAIEKCMLPVGVRPIIDYVVQDIVAAGIEDIYFVVGEQSSQLQSYYRSNILLNDYLKKVGKTELLSKVAPLKGVRIHFLTQPSTGGYGTSVPVGLCEEFIEEGEQALVIMGDQFFLRSDGGSNAADLIALVHASTARAGLLGVPVPQSEVSKYGIIEKDENGNFVQIVERPTPEEAPGNLNNASFYLFPHEVFRLAKTLPANPKRGEFEITDAINAYVQSGEACIVGEAQGAYLDGGTPEGWLHANNYIAQQT